MKFTISARDPQSKARSGQIETAHGQIQTPIFMPVGTLGSVKGIHQHELADEIKAQIILGNTYHLYLRPGMHIIEQAGGLHRFINWEKPILTDSGGYQVFSLASNRKLSDKGAMFQSHIDGSRHTFTPESVVDIQRSIGSDIMMALDECTPFPCDKKYAKESMELTHRWLKRGKEHFDNTGPKYEANQTFFPIVQGSVYTDLRRQSAETIASYQCQGNAIGGLSVGEPEEDMYAMIETVNTILPDDKPRYLMGVGTPANILNAIALGVDMFDCVMPTRNGRNGMLFTYQGIINIKNKKWENNFSPIDPDGTTLVDKEYSKAYLRHLLVANERLAAQIASIHNLAFYLRLVTDAKKHIENGTFAKWKDYTIKNVSNRL